VTKLEKPLRREIEIGTKRYTLVVDPLGLKLKQKGHRHGLDLHWAALAKQLGDVPGLSSTPAA
jgi:hypothetical protein